MTLSSSPGASEPHRGLCLGYIKIIYTLATCLFPHLCIYKAAYTHISQLHSCLLGSDNLISNLHSYFSSSPHRFSGGKVSVHSHQDLPQGWENPRWPGEMTLHAAALNPV